ncbi:hypothetical protein FACS1894120_1080 [Clostridia bacterium]|nr:hypothetical protein FACS1894120_1080 [Clostridia bacterium]
MTIQLKVFMSVFLIILLTAILTMPLEAAAQESETAEVTAIADTDVVTTDVTTVITEPIVFDETSAKTDTATEPQTDSETETNANSETSTEIANDNDVKSDEISLPTGAFTPDGNATVINNVTDGTKEFFTIKTADDAVFYLVVDRQRNSENVYFLNAVTVDDLVPLAKNGDNIKSTQSNKSTDDNDTSANEKTSEKPAPENKESNLPLIIIAVIAVGGVAYYVKIIRPKKAGFDMSDMEFDEEVDEDSELNFEDENDDDEVYIEEKDE